MNRLLCDNWTSEPPRIKYISDIMPKSPNLPLTGSGHTDMSVESFIKDLERDIKNQQGRYFATVCGCWKSQDEADIYALQTWQVCIPEDGTYEAVILLYYAPMNHYLTLKKHFGEEDAHSYLGKLAARNAAINALAEVLE